MAVRCYTDCNGDVLMGAAHTALIDSFLLTVSRFPRLGRFWKHPSGLCESVNGYKIKYGLKGSSDVIGILGNGHGTFIGLEFKVGADRLSEAQGNFRRMIQEFHGVYLEVRDTKIALKNLEELCQNK